MIAARNTLKGLISSIETLFWNTIFYPHVHIDLRGAEGCAYKGELLADNDEEGGDKDI